MRILMSALVLVSCGGCILSGGQDWKSPTQNAYYKVPAEDVQQAVRAAYKELEIPIEHDDAGSFRSKKVDENSKVSWVLHARVRPDDDVTRVETWMEVKHDRYMKVTLVDDLLSSALGPKRRLRKLEKEYEEGKISSGQFEDERRELEEEIAEDEVEQRSNAAEQDRERLERVTHYSDKLLKRVAQLLPAPASE